MAVDRRFRLRGNFAEVLQRQAGELANLAREALRDEDVQDALRFELDRIRGTAESLNIPSVERAARAALEACDRGDANDAVARLVDACLALDGLEPVLRPVILITSEPPPTGDLAMVLRVAASVDHAFELARAEDPSAFVVDIELLDQLVQRAEGKARAVPVYAVGPRRDLSRRIEASTLGAVAYLSRPLDMRSMVERVRAGTGEADPPPYRILLIEPDSDQGRRVARGLQGPDRAVRWVRDPERILQALDEFWPEALLIASNCGSMSGIDLARVVRGHEQFGDLPVMFLADADDVERTGYVAMADDIVVKPVVPALLRERLLARLKRGRRAQAARERDLLTGCLNRGAFLRLVDREIGLAERASTVVSVLLVDVDGMRSLNAESGLGAGDRALWGLSRILGKTVRETDALGRVAGDCFGVLMRDCEAADALRRVDTCRERYASWCEMRRLGTLAFSVGAADTGGGLRDVIMRADRALIEARRTGGRRGVIDRPDDD